NLLYVGYYHFQSPEQLARARVRLKGEERFKGAQDVFSLNRYGDQVHFFINGYLSHDMNEPAEKIVGAFPALFAPRMDRALILGVGRGATGGRVASLFERTDGVEINPVILHNLWRMSAYNFDILKKPGVQLFQDDGVHFMKAGREPYSLIINTVTSPRYFSS